MELDEKKNWMFTKFLLKFSQYFVFAPIQKFWASKNPVK